MDRVGDWSFFGPGCGWQRVRIASGPRRLNRKVTLGFAGRLKSCPPERASLTPIQVLDRFRIDKGECFAKAYISTAETPPREDTRVSRAHEKRRRPQGAGVAPQEGPSSAHARVAAWAPRRA